KVCSCADLGLRSVRRQTLFLNLLRRKMLSGQTERRRVVPIPYAGLSLDSDNRTVGISLRPLHFLAFFALRSSFNAKLAKLRKARKRTTHMTTAIVHHPIF